MLHGNHCIQSGSIWLRCMESTAFNQDPSGQAACIPLHSIGINYTKLHVVPFIQSRNMAPLCIESTAFKHAACDPLHSIRYHWATLYAIHCIHSASIAPCCMEYTAFNRDTFSQMPGIHCIHSRCISRRCMECSTFNPASWIPLHSIGIHWAKLHAIHCSHSGCISHC